MTETRALKDLPLGTRFRLPGDKSEDYLIVCQFSGAIGNLIDPKWIPFLDPSTHKIDVLPSYGQVIEVDS